MVSRAYLEDVTAAEFCEEGGHGLEVGEAHSLADCDELRLVQGGVRKHVELYLHRSIAEEWLAFGDHSKKPQ